MDSFWEFLKQLVDPQSIIHHGGLLLLLIVIFAENGFIFGFFLPGDSLIFLSGLICASRPELLDVNIATLVLAMFLAAVLGSLFGYLFGKRVGKNLFKRKESLIFKHRYLEVTQNYYDKYGGPTLIMGRFLPIVRTFAPIIAGIIKVPFHIFISYNLIGGALWICSLSLIGYFIGVKYPVVENYLGYIIVGFVGITTIIVARSFVNHRKALREEKAKENG